MKLTDKIIFEVAGKQVAQKIIAGEKITPEDWINFARAIEAEVLRGRGEAKPVLFVDPDSLAELLADNCSGITCGVYSERYRRTMPLYVTPPQQEQAAPVQDGLVARCREILDWQKTGVLTGDALRSFAKQKYGDAHDALLCAEHDTAREAYAMIAAAPKVG